MIPQNELRIGNYVFIPDIKDLATVEQIMKHEITVNEFGRFFNLNHIDPIPITEDLLIRLGFELSESKLTKKTYINKSPFPVYVYRDGVFSMLNPNWTVVIDYVHQLQNLYFALTGKELELKQNT